MGALLQDLRYGARIIWRQPGYSFLIALTLALAIGANTVIFSFANVLALRTLSVKDQETLGWIFLNDPQRGGTRGSLSVTELLDYRTSLQSFESIAATTPAAFTMTGPSRGGHSRPPTPSWRCRSPSSTPRWRGATGAASERRSTRESSSKGTITG